jgi:hypothetical protein
MNDYQEMKKILHRSLKRLEMVGEEIDASDFHHAGRLAFAVEHDVRRACVLGMHACVVSKGGLECYPVHLPSLMRDLTQIVKVRDVNEPSRQRKPYFTAIDDRSSSIATARVNLREAIQELRTYLHSLDEMMTNHPASPMEKPPEDEAALARGAMAELIVGPILEWSKDPNIDDVAVEVYLSARDSKGKREWIKLTLHTCSDALQKGLRRRYGRYGRCFLEAIPSASLAALPYFVSAAQRLGWVFPGSVFAAGGITLVLGVSISGLWNAYKEWTRPEGVSPRFKQ